MWGMPYSCSWLVIDMCFVCDVNNSYVGHDSSLCGILFLVGTAVLYRVCSTHEQVMSYTHEEVMYYIPQLNKSCTIFHTWTSHVLYSTHEQVMYYIAHMNKSCTIFHTWTSHVLYSTHEQVMYYIAHMNKSWGHDNGTWLITAWNASSMCVTWLIALGSHMWRDLFMCGTWLIHHY